MPLERKKVTIAQVVWATRWVGAYPSAEMLSVYLITLGDKVTHSAERGSNPSAEMRSVYFIAPADWARYSG